MRLVPDEGPIEDLAAASADPAFGDRVHARRPDVAEHGPDPGLGENGGERSGVGRAAVADNELDLVRLLAEVHDQAAGLLGGPRPGGMHCDADCADARSGTPSGSRRAGSRAVPGPPSPNPGDAAAAAARRRAGGAGAGSPRSSMSPHAETAAARRPSA